MNQIPTILEEEGKLFEDFLEKDKIIVGNMTSTNGAGKEILISPNMRAVIGFLLVSHKRVLGEVVKMVKSKKQNNINQSTGFPFHKEFNKGSVAGYNEAISDILFSLQEGIDTKI